MERAERTQGEAIEQGEDDSRYCARRGTQPRPWPTSGDRAPRRHTREGRTRKIPANKRPSSPPLPAAPNVPRRTMRLRRQNAHPLRTTGSHNHRGAPGDNAPQTRRNGRRPYSLPRPPRPNTPRVNPPPPSPHAPHPPGPDAVVHAAHPRCSPLRVTHLSGAQRRGGGAKLSRPHTFLVAQYTCTRPSLTSPRPPPRPSQFLPISRRMPSPLKRSRKLNLSKTTHNHFRKIPSSRKINQKIKRLFFLTIKAAKFPL